ncbi:MAG: PEP-CTERM sorting domain-containing protein [Gemmatimonadetes bacterium]|nr:PEP-CTERM sorting domain-containing protein [Gemmatimonadota bacterium]
MTASSLPLTGARRATALAAVVAAFVALPGTARTQGPSVLTPTPMVLDFEPLSTAAGCDDNDIVGYGGLAWSGFGAMDKVECGAAEVGGPKNGYWFGATSGTNTGYIQLPRFSDPFGALGATISYSDTFDLLDAWLSSAWTTNLRVTVTGFNGTTLVGTRSFMLDYTAPQHAEFNLFGITSARFLAYDGVVRYELGGIGNIMVLDDLSVVKYVPTVVPEPAGVLLVASGLALVGLAARRRRHPAQSS